MKKTLLTIIGALILAACSGGDPTISDSSVSQSEDVASQEQALPACNGPTSLGYHTLSNISVVQFQAGCSANTYLAGEPHSWQLPVKTGSGVTIGVVPPKRADGGCSCTQLAPFVMYQGTCTATQGWRCKYGPGCAFARDYYAVYGGQNNDFSIVNIQIDITGLGEGISSTTGLPCHRFVQAKFNL